MRTCPRCGECKPLDEFARDASKASGYKSFCKGCDRERSKAYYAANREAVLARAAAKRPVRAERAEECSECGAKLEGARRLVCSSRCGAARFKRLNPEGYAAREARKVVWRRERRRRGGS